MIQKGLDINESEKILIRKWDLVTFRDVYEKNHTQKEIMYSTAQLEKQLRLMWDKDIEYNEHQELRHL